MVMDWYRSGNEVVSRKKAERKGFNNTFYIPTDNTDWHGSFLLAVLSVGIREIRGIRGNNIPYIQS